LTIFSFILWKKIKPRFGFDGEIYCEVLQMTLLFQALVVYQEVRLASKDQLGFGSEMDAKNGETVLWLKHTGFKGIRNFVPYLVMGKGSIKSSKRIFKDLENQPV